MSHSSCDKKLCPYLFQTNPRTSRHAPPHRSKRCGRHLSSPTLHAENDLQNEFHDSHELHRVAPWIQRRRCSMAQERCHPNTDNASLSPTTFTDTRTGTGDARHSTERDRLTRIIHQSVSSIELIPGIVRTLTKACNTNLRQRRPDQPRNNMHCSHGMARDTTQVPPRRVNWYCHNARLIRSGNLSQNDYGGGGGGGGSGSGSGSGWGGVGPPTHPPTPPPPHTHTLG